MIYSLGTEILHARTPERGDCTPRTVSTRVDSSEQEEVEVSRLGSPECRLESYHSSEER